MDLYAVFSHRMFNFAVMKQRLFHFVLLLLLMTFGQQQEVFAVERCNESVPVSDQIYDNDSKHQPLGEALLTDVYDGYRIATPRLLRLPTMGGGRPIGQRLVAFSLKTPIILIHDHYDGRRRQEVSPHQSAVSCQYYIIALRRILR